MLINFHFLPFLIDFFHAALIRLRNALVLSTVARLDLHKVGDARIAVWTLEIRRPELTQSRLATRAEGFQTSFSESRGGGGVTTSYASIVQILGCRCAVVFGMDVIKLHLL